MAEQVTELLRSYLSPELVVFIISMLPVLELRGGLIAASLLGIPWRTATVISLLGNALPIPFILLFLRQVLLFLKKLKPFQKLVLWIENRAQAKCAEVMEKHPHRIQLALFLFVAIPLPGTGAWTGALIAVFLGIKMRKSVGPISLGILGAAVIMLTITYFLPFLAGLK